MIETPTDPNEIEAIKQLIVDSVENCNHLSLPYLASRKWAAVPVESALHFDDNDAKGISEAGRMIGYSECFAVLIENIKEPPCYRVPMTIEGLLDFSHQCSLWKYALVPEDKAFVILCTVEDYFLVAGEKAFVTKALGMPIKQARKKFFECANNDCWTYKGVNPMLEVAERYAPFDG